MYTLGDAIMIDTPMPLKTLPTNNQKVEAKVPTKIHPNVIIGEQSKNVLLIPMTSAIFPPIGVKMMAISESMLANQDTWSSSRSRLASEIPPNPWINPKEMTAKEALMAANTSENEIAVIF